MNQFQKFTNNTLPLGTAETTSVVNGSVTVMGFTNTPLTVENIYTIAYSANLAIKMTNGMVMYCVPTGAVSTLSITLPVFPVTAYTFTFLMKTSTAGNIIANNVTVINESTLQSTAVTVYGTSAVSGTFTYILQSFSLMNISETTTPSWICLVSAQTY